MDLRIIYAALLAVLPVSELRGGLPLAIIYAKDNGVPIILVFLLIVLINILAVFLAFFFLDKVHHRLMGIRIYRRIFDFYIKRIQGKTDRLEEKYSLIGFLALAVFVAIPLPATGAWSGALISWILNLDRKKSIFAISLGVIMAGVLVLLGTLGILGIFNLN